jgi:hypothetical protein
LRFGHQRVDARSLALEDLFTLEVAAIGQGRELLDTHRLTRLLAHGGELRAIRPAVRDFVGDNHVVLGIHRRLHVVAHDTGTVAAGRHRAGIRIGQRDLPIRARLHLFAHLFELLHLGPDRLDLVLQMLDARFRHRTRVPIRTIQIPQIPRSPTTESASAA